MALAPVCATSWRFAAALAMAQMLARQKKDLQELVNCIVSPLLRPLLLQLPLWGQLSPSTFLA